MFQHQNIYLCPRVQYLSIYIQICNQIIFIKTGVGFKMFFKKAFSLKFATFYPKNMDLRSLGTTFQAKDLKIQKNKSPNKIPEFTSGNLPFGKGHTDHMVVIDSINGIWGKPKIVPYENLSLSPFNSSLHYGIQCFEGLKSYKDLSGKIRLFRPDCNMKRFKQSSKRLALPDFDGNQLIKCIEQLVRLEQKWIPPITGFSLYLRPLHISMEQSLGVKAASKSRIIIMASPTGPYYPTGFNPIALTTGTQVVRSCHKGTGSFKIGGNYSPTLKYTVNAVQRGYSQILWLYGEERNEQVIQIGASNIFFVNKTSNPKILEILTPELQDLILPGVTRDSIIELAKLYPEYIVSQRTVMMKEILMKLQKNELAQCFGAGTAVIVSPVKQIQYRGSTFKIPIDQKLNSGKVSFNIRKQLLDIQEGRAEDKLNWVKIIN